MPLNFKKFSLCILFFLILTSSILIYYYGQKHKCIDLKITSITMKSNTPSSQREFDTIIEFKNDGENIHNWQFGFFMMGTPFCKINTENQKYNVNLTMKICDDQNRCQKLNYNVSKNSIPDLSQGYTNIFSPNNYFPLLTGHKYKILLLKNQWQGRNFTYFPQHFFIILEKKLFQKSSIFNLKTNPSNYKLINYDQYEVKEKIKDHLKKNWESSLPSSKINNVIIPHPVSISFKKGNYVLKSDIYILDKIKISKEIKSLMKEIFTRDFNLNLLFKSGIGSPAIIIEKINNKSQVKNNPEGYILDISPEGIKIEAITQAGVFFAMQSLRQLIHHYQSRTTTQSISLPHINLIDYPRFRYRGLMLDTVRHFFSVTEIKKLIEIMALHKLNSLHLHLSDDEAFRVDIPNYPSLKKIGGYRGFGMPLGPAMLTQGNLFDLGTSTPQDVNPETVYGGAYNSDDIKEIISCANTHQITVIPEIDLPAHARALIKALPEVMVDQSDSSVYMSCQGYTDNVIPVCHYNEKTFFGEKFTKTLNDIINYIATLFNGQTTIYALEREISIAGDEVSPNAWTEANACLKKWSGLTALEKSQRFFQLLSQYHKTLLFSGWQQLVQTNSNSLSNYRIPNSRTGHIWVWDSSSNGVPQAVELAKNGYPTILAFSDKTYFDLTYTPDINELGLYWANEFVDTYEALSSILPINKILDQLSQSSQDKILGIEAALWSENIASFEYLVYMLLPKLAGLSESSWSPREVSATNTKINWKNLVYRLGNGCKKGFLSYLHKSHNVKYRGFPYGISKEIPSNVTLAIN